MRPVVIILIICCWAMACTTPANNSFTINGTTTKNKLFIKAKAALISFDDSSFNPVVIDTTTIAPSGKFLLSTFSAPNQLFALQINNKIFWLVNDATSIDVDIKQVKDSSFNYTINGSNSTNAIHSFIYITDSLNKKLSDSVWVKPSDNKKINDSLFLIHQQKIKDKKLALQQFVKQQIKKAGNTSEQLLYLHYGSSIKAISKDSALDICQQSLKNNKQNILLKALTKRLKNQISADTLVLNLPKTTL